MWLRKLPLQIIVAYTCTLLIRYKNDGCLVMATIQHGKYVRCSMNVKGQYEANFFLLMVYHFRYRLFIISNSLAMVESSNLDPSPNPQTWMFRWQQWRHVAGARRHYQCSVPTLRSTFWVLPCCCRVLPCYCGVLPCYCACYCGVLHCYCSPLCYCESSLAIAESFLAIAADCLNTADCLNI